MVNAAASTIAPADETIILLLFRAVPEFVPPFATGRIPLTLVVKSTVPVDRTPAALFLTIPAVLKPDKVVVPVAVRFPVTLNKVPFQVKSFDPVRVLVPL